MALFAAILSKSGQVGKCGVFFFCLCWKEGLKTSYRLFYCILPSFPLVPERNEIHPLGRLNRHAWGKLHGSFPPPTFQTFNPTLNT